MNNKQAWSQVADHKELTFRQYFILNKVTTIHCLKICAFLFGAIGTIAIFLIQLETGDKGDSWEVLIASEAFGYGFALFVFIGAFIDGYAKARATIKQFNKIDNHLKKQYSICLVKQPLNPKYWFMQFDIVRKRGDKYLPIDEQLKRLLIK